MPTLQLGTTLRTAMMAVVESTIGVTPTITIRSGALPANCAAARIGTVLATIVLPSDWLTTAAAGAVSMVGGPWNDTVADATGTAGHFSLDQGATCHVQGDITLTAGGGAMTLDSLSVTAAQLVSVTSFTLTQGGA